MVEGEAVKVPDYPGIWSLRRLHSLHHTMGRLQPGQFAYQVVMGRSSARNVPLLNPETHPSAILIMGLW